MDNYVFVVRHKYNSKGEVSLEVRGVKVEGILIDSGTSLIDYKTWTYWKQNYVVCQSAQKEPIDVAGTFTTEILCEANGETCINEFKIIKGDG